VHEAELKQEHSLYRMSRIANEKMQHYVDNLREKVKAMEGKVSEKD